MAVPDCCVTLLELKRAVLKVTEDLRLETGDRYNLLSYNLSQAQLAVKDEESKVSTEVYSWVLARLNLEVAQARMSKANEDYQDYLLSL